MRRKSRFPLKIILRGICAAIYNRLDGAYPSPLTGTVQEGASPGESTLNNDSFVATELPLQTRLLLLLPKPTPSPPLAQPLPLPPPSSSSLSPPPYRSHHHQRIMRRWPEGATTSKRRREVAARSLFQQRTRNTPTLAWLADWLAVTLHTKS